MLSIAIAAHFTIRKFATARTEWNLTEQGINITWITQYFGNKSGNIDIKWEEIKKYKDLYGRGYNLFKIFLHDGNVVQFGHGGLFINDDFNKFYNDFQELFIKSKYPEDWQKYYAKKSRFQ